MYMKECLMKQKIELRHIKQANIETEKWDNCIAKSINGLVYAYSWYLDIVSPNWEALVYGDYETVMPLTQNQKYGVSYLFQPFFTQQLGIFSCNKIDESLIYQFLNSIPKKYKFIEINLNKYNRIEKLKGFAIRENNNYELDLIENYENIFRKYKQNNIRNIRKAIQKKVSILKGLMPNDIFALIKASDRIPGMKEAHLNTLRQLFAASIRYKSGYVYGAYNEQNTLVAAGFFVYSNNRACFILSVSSDEGKQLSAMFLLIDEFIKDFSNRNMILDFEGSNVDSVARFYKGFGANQFHYPSLRANNLPFPLKLIKN
jgi:hypothetical protein